MSVKFYNAGDKISEILPYSIPTGQDVHCVARYTLNAPKEEFFTVPDAIEVQQTGDTIAVQFARDISTKFGARGVIRIRPDYDPEQEDPEKGIEHYPYAQDEQAAIARGQEIWHAYLRKIVESHLQDCEAARAAGGAPRSAMGFTKRALKLLNIQDPGEQYFNSLQHGGAGEEKTTDPAVAELRAQNQTILALLTAVLQGKTVEPDAVAKLTVPAGEVVTSGIVTGEIKKPITGGDVTPKAVENPRGRNDRAKAAAEHL